MTAGGGASWATAGWMIQAAATSSVVRAMWRGQSGQLVVNFIPFIVIPLNLCRCPHSIGETRQQAKRGELLGKSRQSGERGWNHSSNQLIARLEIQPNVRFLEVETGDSWSRLPIHREYTTE